MTGSRDPLYDALHDLEASGPFEPPPALKQSRRPVWLTAGAVGALAAVAAALAIVFVTSQDRSVGDATPSPSPATPTASPSPTAASPSPSETAPPPSPSPETPPTGWRQISFDAGTELEQRSGFTLNGLTYDAPLERWFTSEGYRDWAGTLDPLPVFSSEDGASWSHTGSLPLPTDFAPDGTIAEAVQVGRIFRIGDVLYLSGEHSRGVDFSRALAWTSFDGNGWADTPTDLPSEATVVASSGGALVARTTYFTFEGTRLWRSSDGSTWTASVLPTSEAVSLNVYGDGQGFIAYGATMERQAEDRTPLMWRSADGVTWEAMELPADLRFIGEAARFLDGRYLMWGSVTPLSAKDRGVQLWVSDDGASWTPSASFGVAGSASAIGTSSSGAVYLGVHDGFLRAWESADGLSWRELPAEQEVPEVIRTGHVVDLVFVQSLVVTADQWVGMGQGNEDFVSDLWLGAIDP